MSYILIGFTCGSILAVTAYGFRYVFDLFNTLTMLNNKGGYSDEE